MYPEAVAYVSEQRLTVVVPGLTVAGETMNAAAADEPEMAIVSVGPPLFASVVLRSRFVTESLLVEPDVAPKPHDVPFERL